MRFRKLLNQEQPLYNFMHWVCYIMWHPRQDTLLVGSEDFNVWMWNTTDRIALLLALLVITAV
ncbi:hypothetical protein JHK87_009969 [Glycine soja]|nr:hypothetical protein JHK87_009969 [Glycine soja]KAG5066369.1 hypothetical protein JHK86_010100 [Glycine max]